MGAYYFLIGCVMALGLVYRRKIINKKAFLVITGALFFLLFAFRDYSVGRDLLQYKNRYDNYDLLFGNVGIRYAEFGYNYFSLLFSRILHMDFRIFIVVVSGLIVSVTWKVYSRYSDDIFYSIVMYITIGLFTFNLSGIRQSLACIIVLLSIKQVEERNLLKFILLVLLATTFHNSAIIFLPVYFIYGIRINQKRGFGIFIASLGLTFLLLRALPYITFIFPQRFRNYNLNMQYKLNPLVVIVPSLILVYILVYLKREEDGKYGKMDSLFILFSCIQIIFLMLNIANPLIGRLCHYFAIGQSVLLPKAIINHTKSYYGQGSIIRILSLFLFIAYFAISSSGDSFSVDAYKIMSF